MWNYPKSQSKINHQIAVDTDLVKLPIPQPESVQFPPVDVLPQPESVPLQPVDMANFPKLYLSILEVIGNLSQDDNSLANPKKGY